MKTGELIIGAVINRTASGMMLKVLCTAGPTSRYVADINVKVTIYLYYYNINTLKTLTFIALFGLTSSHLSQGPNTVEN